MHFFTCLILLHHVDYSSVRQPYTQLLTLRIHQKTMLFHIIYHILASFIYLSVSFVNPYESCGFEYLLLYKCILPFIFFASVSMFFLLNSRKSIKTVFLCNILMAFPLSFLIHGVCEHTTYSWLNFLALIQIVYYIPLIIIQIYKQLTISNVVSLFLFVLIFTCILIWGPSIYVTL